jgi:hypothetical protein
LREPKQIQAAARGYLNDPALDAVAFVADPLGSAARLYRSGDIGCWNPDGTLSFRGRNDAQVKVNGVRIEPAEVTGALEKHPSVAAAEVVLRNDDPANPYLAAYWIPGASTPEPPTGAQLSAFLRTVLPEAMIPSLFVAVDRFPLNANGKLDRAALPAPSSPRYGNADRTDLEIGVHQAWVHALGHDGFGPDDHFVLVGGTSLAAMRLVARLESALDRPLPHPPPTPPARRRPPSRPRKSVVGEPRRAGRGPATRPRKPRNKREAAPSSAWPGPPPQP